MPMSERSFELLMRFMQTITALAAVGGPCYIAYLQSHTDKKVDEVIVKAVQAASAAAQVKKDLQVQSTEIKKAVEESSEERDDKLHTLTKTALETKASLNNWKADYTKDPADRAAAQEAEDMLTKHADGTTRSAAAVPSP